MMHPTYLLLAVFIGLAVGVSSGYGISFSLLTPEDRAALNAAPYLPTDEPRYVRMRGTILSVDLTKKTMVLDAFSPYARTGRVLLRLHFDPSIRIDSPTDPVLSQSDVLKSGKNVSAHIAREGGALRVILISSTNNLK